MNWPPPAKGVSHGSCGYAWVGLVVFAVVVARLFGLVFVFLTSPSLERLARRPSHTSRFIQPGQYNMSRVRVIGGLTPNIASNKSKRPSKANHSSQPILPSRTFHTIQSRLNS